MVLLLLLYMDVPTFEGWYHIRKFIPLDWSVILFGCERGVSVVRVERFCRQNYENYEFILGHYEFMVQVFNSNVGFEASRRNYEFILRV